MTERRFVHPLLGERIVGIANQPDHYGARRFCAPSYGRMTNLIKSLGAALMEHDGSLYRVASGSLTPRMARTSETSIRLDLGTYRLGVEVDRVTEDSADVATAAAPTDYLRILAEQAQATTETQAQKGSLVYTKLEISFEIEMGNFLGNASLWTHSATLSGTGKFSHAASDPLKRLEQLCADVGCGRKMAMGWDAWHALSYNEKVRTGIAGTNDGHKLTLEAFKTFARQEWMIEDVVVSRARRKSDGAYSYLWGDWIHVGSPGENLVPVGDQFSVNQQSLIRVVNPVPDQTAMRGRMPGTHGDERDGYLAEILDDPDCEVTTLKLSRRGAIVPLVADAGGTLLDVA